jgi:sugar phosphate isomerase/epimerase
VVKLASLGKPAERRAAVSYWKKAIEIAMEMDCDTMNSEFGHGSLPDRTSHSNCYGGQHSDRARLLRYFFSALAEIKFDGIMTSCVFAREDRAEDSSRFMRKEIQRYVDKYWI